MTLKRKKSSLRTSHSPAISKPTRGKSNDSSSSLRKSQNVTRFDSRQIDKIGPSLNGRHRSIDRQRRIKHQHNSRYPANITSRSESKNECRSKSLRKTRNSVCTHTKSIDNSWSQTPANAADNLDDKRRACNIGVGEGKRWTNIHQSNKDSLSLTSTDKKSLKKEQHKKSDTRDLRRHLSYNQNHRGNKESHQTLDNDAIDFGDRIVRNANNKSSGPRRQPAVNSSATDDKDSVGGVPPDLERDKHLENENNVLFEKILKSLECQMGLQSPIWKTLNDDAYLLDELQSLFDAIHPPEDLRPIRVNDKQVIRISEIDEILDKMDSMAYFNSG